MSARTIESIVAGQQVTDGAGVRITRLLTQAQQRRLDPFLMLDNFRSDDPKDYIAGFPDHPHRGFETVTYMIAGRMRHRDNAGHEGLLENGGIQWMVAGRGIVHSEMPEQEDGAMEGFQLWLNLPAANKMADPWYRDFQSADIPEYTTPDGVTVRVIAGESQLRQGAVTREVTEPLYLDIHLPASSRFEQALPPGHNASSWSTAVRWPSPVASCASDRWRFLRTPPMPTASSSKRPQVQKRFWSLAGRSMSPSRSMALS